MVYIYHIDNERLQLQNVFENDVEFATYLGDKNVYRSILLTQRLAKTDICRKKEYIFDPNENALYSILYTEDRDIVIKDEYGRILDVRNFIPLIPKDPAIYEARWKKQQEKMCNNIGRCKRQGKTHKKNGKYIYKSKSVHDVKPDFDEIDNTLRHRNRVLRNHNKCYDSYKPVANNWKCAKVKRQYMWHKRKHEDTYFPAVCIEECNGEEY